MTPNSSTLKIQRLRLSIINDDDDFEQQTFYWNSLGAFEVWSSKNWNEKKIKKKRFDEELELKAP